MRYDSAGTPPSPWEMTSASPYPVPTAGPNALAAGEAPSWVAAMLGHASPEMLFSVYARYIPKRARRDGSAFVSRMEAKEVPKPAEEGAAVLPKYSG